MRRSAYKDSGVGWLLLNCIISLHWDREKQSVKGYVRANYKEALISYKERVDPAKQQPEDLIVRIPEFETLSKQICYA